jgi:hypothetical protein
MSTTNPTDQAQPATRRGKDKGGALTREQRTRKLRRQAGYGTIQLAPGGVLITCRESDGFVNLAEIFAAEAEQRGGKPKQLSHWRALKTSPAYLEAEGLATGIPVASLITIGAGSTDTWAHHTVACEIARWLSPALGVAINQLWMDTLNRIRRRPRQLDVNGALIVQGRKEAHKDLAAVAVERGVPPEWLHQQKVFGLTGKLPKHWAEHFGTRSWQGRASLKHQNLQRLAAEAAASGCAALDPEGKTRRDYTAIAKRAGQALRAFAEEFGLPWQPDNEGPAFTAARVQRSLTSPSEA